MNNKTWDAIQKFGEAIIELDDFGLLDGTDLDMLWAIHDGLMGDEE